MAIKILQSLVNDLLSHIAYFVVSLIPGAKARPGFSPFLKFCDKCRFQTILNMTSDIENYLQVPKKTCMYKMMFYCADIMAKFHNLLVIALVIIRRIHKAHITDRGAENPTGPK